jgi:hypothetical protein
VELPEKADEVPEGPVASDTPCHIEVRAKCKYYAGIWGSDFLSGLCWHARIGVSGRTYRDYIAPSWSWASQDGPIDYLWKGFQGNYTADGYDGPVFSRPEFIAKVLNIKVDLASLNAFGAVCGGFLEIEGFWIPDLGKATENDHTGIEEGDEFEGVVFDDENMAIEGDICGLVLGGFGKKLGDITYFFGLLLTVVDQEESLYKRIGFFTSVYDAEDAEVWGEIEQKTITIQ